MGFRTYLWDRRRSWLLALGLLAVLLMVLLLFRLPVLAVGYGALLCGVIYLGAGIWDFVQWSRRHHRLQNLEQEVLSTLDNLPPPGSSLEEDYQRLLVSLFRAKAAQSAESSSRFQNMTDYYTLWAHQIKTPIAAMRLLLQEEETRTGELEQELFKIEQYADMALQYQRLESLSSDLQLESCSLDGILRQALKKMATPFIRRRISLEFDGTGATVLTDEKWLTFVVEQLLSNALKYTPPGGRITLYLEADKTLVVEDNGIGIRAEDIPRIFERGFTGFNGRMDKKSTGIGLYLCRRILSRLSHTIAIESRPGEGTRVRVGLASQAIELQ